MFHLHTSDRTPKETVGLILMQKWKSVTICGFGMTFWFSRTLRIPLRIVETAGKLAAAFSDINANSLPKICWEVSSVVSAFRFMLVKTFVTSTSLAEGAWVCSLFCSINSSVGESFTIALHWLSFLLKTHSQELLSLASCFLKTYI